MRLLCATESLIGKASASGVSREQWNWVRIFNGCFWHFQKANMSFGKAENESRSIKFKSSFNQAWIKLETSFHHVRIKFDFSSTQVQIKIESESLKFDKNRCKLQFLTKFISMFVRRLNFNQVVIHVDVSSVQVCSSPANLYQITL